MNTKVIKRSVVCLALINVFVCVFAQMDFNSGWKFKKGNDSLAFSPQCNDGNWEQVYLPHTWNAMDMLPGKPKAKSYVGVAWYRKNFTVSKEKDQTLLLEFGAVGNICEIYVDGKFIGGNKAGYKSFRMEISEALNIGTDLHTVAVKVDNAYQLRSLPYAGGDWERYGGMHREVVLHTKKGAFLDFHSVQLYTPQVSAESATVKINASIWEKYKKKRNVLLKHTIYSPQGEIVECKEINTQTVYGRTVFATTEDFVVRKPMLWSPEHPNLYKVKTELWEGDNLLDYEINNLGFRWGEFTSDKGFLLNGRPLKLVGVNAHHEFPGMGNALPERLLVNEMVMMKKAGMNYYRTSHFAKSKYIMNACDSLGILVLAENPFWHGSMRVNFGEDLATLIKQDTGRLVDLYNNHPSVIAWNTVNEIMYSYSSMLGWLPPSERGSGNTLQKAEWPFARRMVMLMNDEFHRKDPYRPTCLIAGGLWKNNYEAGILELADIVGLNGGAMHDMKADNGKSAYDFLHEENPEYKIIMSEGVLNKFKDKHRDRCMWNQEFIHWKTVASHWMDIYEREWFAGGSMWSFANYSAAGVIREKGAVDMHRLPYEIYYFLCSQWSYEPFIHINGHWNREENEETEVTVFTNCRSAELFLNGKSLGVKTPDVENWKSLPHPPVSWKVPYVKGELRVEAVKEDGTKITDVRTTASQPKQVVLTSMDKTLIPDGRDALYIDVTVTDKKGNRCYLYNGMVEVSVAGAGKYVNGTEKVQVLGGLGRFAVQSNGQKGEVLIKSNDSQFPSKTLSIKAD